MRHARIALFAALALASAGAAHAQSTAPREPMTPPVLLGGGVAGRSGSSTVWRVDRLGAGVVPAEQAAVG